MSDSNSTSDSTTPDGAEIQADAPDGTTDAETKEAQLVSRAELEEAIKRRDSFAAKARKLEEQTKTEREQTQAELKALNAKLKEFEGIKRKGDEDEAAKAGDIERLRKSWADEKAELQKQLEAKDHTANETLAQAEKLFAEAKGTILRGEAFRTLSEITTDPEVAFMLVKDRLDLVDDDNGSKTIRVKDDMRDFKTFVERNFEERGKSYLLKTQRKAGSGAQPQQGNEGTKSGSVALEQIERMTPSQQMEAFKNNPNLAKELLAKASIR